MSNLINYNNNDLTMRPYSPQDMPGIQRQTEFNDTPIAGLSYSKDMYEDATIPYGIIGFQNEPSNSSDWFGESELVVFQRWYAIYHGYVSVVVCVVGGICNMINIAVLTRSNMRSTTNYLLTALALSDLLTMVSYIPFALQFYCIHGLIPSPDRNSRNWILFFLFHVNFSVTTHTISIWLGVTLSIFRYIYLKQSAAGGGGSCGMIQARLACLAVTIGSVIVLLPNYLSLQVIHYPDRLSNRTTYDLISCESTLITNINFWIHALVIKIIPCVLMSIFGMLLICTMHTTNQRNRKLRTPSMSKHARTSQQTRRRDHSRTTSMLVAVIVLFLVTEFPQGVLALCSGLLPGFFEAYYVPLGDTMDILALINNGINFTLYCSMSRQFRETFLRLFFPCLLPPEKRNRGVYAEFGLHAAARNFFNRERLPVASAWSTV